MSAFTNEELDSLYERARALAAFNGSLSPAERKGYLDIAAAIQGIFDERERITRFSRQPRDGHRYQGELVPNFNNDPPVE